MELEIDTIEIRSRRYLGNKFKLLGFIESIISENVGSYGSFCDMFAGTGVVGEYFNKQDVKIISNDLLHSNFLILSSWLTSTHKNIDIDKIKIYISKFNMLSGKKPNYVSRTFGNKYFSRPNAIKIGLIRDLIDKDGGLNALEKNILITSLIYALDRVANTCGHYDAYRKKMDSFNELILKLPNIKFENNSNNEVFKMDANSLIDHIKIDILYLDPPYNSRQYSDAYHVLENISEWKKPKVFGVAKKMDRSHIKSDYNLSTAKEAFKNLIDSANAKYILLSYNTTENKLNNRSNAKLPTEFIISVLKSKGTLKIYEKEFNQFTTGKTNLNKHKERIYFVKVNK